MASTPLKERKNSSKLWQHATKVFHDNGTIRYIKCNHCAKTSKHQTNASRHLKTVHFNHVAPSLDSKKEPSYTYELKCEIVKKALTGIKQSKIQKDHDVDAETLSKWYTKWFTPDDKVVDKVLGEIQAVPDENINGVDDKPDNNDDSDEEINRNGESHKKRKRNDHDDNEDVLHKKRKRDERHPIWEPWNQAN